MEFGIRKERAVNYVCDEAGTARIFSGVTKAVCSVMTASSKETMGACLDQSNWDQEIVEDYQARRR